MNKYSIVMNGDKLIGFQIYAEEGIRLYTTDEVENSEPYLNYYGIETVRDSNNKIVGIKDKGEPPVIFNNINAPELVLLFINK